MALDLAAGADAPAGVAVIAPMAGKPAAVDLAVAPGANGRLAVAHADGTTRVWSPSVVSDSDSLGFTQDSAFTPFDDAPDAPLASVHFASADVLVVGGENNRALAMWSIPNTPGDDMTNSPEHVQTLAFAPEGDVFNFAACAAPGARLVLVSNLKKQAVYAVHFAEGARGFDYVAEFSTTMPVLSFTALREDADDAAGGAGPGGALQLYCMQTQAIQQYALAVDRCRPAACADDEAAQAEPESESEAETEEFDEDDGGTQCYEDDYAGGTQVLDSAALCDAPTGLDLVLAARKEEVEPPCERGGDAAIRLLRRRLFGVNRERPIDADGCSVPNGDEPRLTLGDPRVEPSPVRPPPALTP